MSETSAPASDEGIVLGIDLGTTFCAMAYVDDHGETQILPNAEGAPTTPSIVYFYDVDGCVVGDEALKMVVTEPENVVRFIKRQMGEPSFDLEFYGKTFIPQEISALILRKLKEDAEALLGEPINNAVITVPAYFHSAQRAATVEAASIAGLNALSIINEPTAAAIAYGLERIGGERNLLVFDLGGGTFDVTVMKIDGSTLATLASDGDAELGGKDWDDCLLDHVAQAFFDEQGVDPRDHPVHYQDLYERILQAKISLSTQERVTVPVAASGKRGSIVVTRQTFETLTAHLLQQCIDTANIVLEKAGLSWSDLDDVLLVGGSTRMPMVRKALGDLSGLEAAAAVNPDESVARGAALAGVLRHRPEHAALSAERRAIAERRQQHRKAQAKSAPARQASASPAAAVGMASAGHVDRSAALQPIDVRDATTHTLGIVALDKSGNERVVHLIPEGTPLPCVHRARFAFARDGSTAVRIEVTEGNGVKRDQVNVVGKIDITGLPERDRGTPMEVKYMYGIDQLLRVKVSDPDSGESREADLRLDGGLQAAELERARRRNQSMGVD